MKVLSWGKDGGPKSNVDGFFVLEIKSLFSIVILKFNKGRREEYHSHAFNAITWFIKGSLIEENLNGEKYVYTKSLFPKITLKSKCHRVLAKETSWVLTLRGPWSKFWQEVDTRNNFIFTLTEGRKIHKVRVRK